jgi:hypothetical protein
LAAFGILALALVPVADALSFFHGKKKEEPIQAIPPVVDYSPTINPNVAAPKPSPAPPSVKPDAIGPTPLEKPLDPLQALIERGVYPESWKDRKNALTRAELADVLVKALKHNTQMVSEFPFYRDVPKGYWAYGAIEVARAKKLMEARGEHGFYYPERPVTFGDAFEAMANAITGPPPTEEEVSFYLVIYPDWEEVPEELWPSVSKMTRARFFEGQLSPALQLLEAPSPEAIAPYIVTLSHLNERRTVLPPHKEELLPYVPGGLTIKVAPTVAIFESHLTIGETVYFSLVEPINELPKGSKLRGTVVDIPTSHNYAIELTEAETPEEKIYRMSAEFPIVFRNKSLPFVVPGETFQAVTRVPANTPPVAKKPPQTAPKKPVAPAIKLAPLPTGQEAR